MREQKIGGAVLDVLKEEKGISYHECTQRTIEHSYLSVLQRMPNVIVTPHMAYRTDRVLVDAVGNII